MTEYFKAIFGSKTEHPLEYRFIIIASFVGVIFSILTALVNFLLGLDVITIVASLIVGLMSVIAYYLSKYLHMYSFSAIMAILILTCILYPGIWIYNGGSHSGISYFVLFNAAISAIFFNKKRYKVLLVLQLFVGIGLFYFEYLFPDVVVQYPSREVRFIDQAFSFAIVFILLFFTIKKVMTAYNQKLEELGMAYRRMELLARTDSLTGLLNRRQMYEELEKEKNKYKATGQSFVLVLADIDNFKSFNDNYGHDCGDLVLVEMARLMKFTIGEEDILCRWGGEEFLFLLPKQKKEDAEFMIEELRKELENKKFLFRGKELNVTATFGMCSFDMYEDIDKTITMADEALYFGKRNGKNAVVLYDEKTNNRTNRLSQL